MAICQHHRKCGRKKRTLGCRRCAKLSGICKLHVNSKGQSACKDCAAGYAAIYERKHRKKLSELAPKQRWRVIRLQFRKRSASAKKGVLTRKLRENRLAENSWETRVAEILRKKKKP